MSSSTIRSAVDPTIGETGANARPTTLKQLVTAEWLHTGRADLVLALRRHPVLLRDKSLLLNLAIEEYKANSSSPLDEHCRRFLEFGSSIHRSIRRQLEAQQYLELHPELLDLFSEPTWPKAGDKFGDFHVVEELGFGAAAHVYLCRQSDLGFRQVVVKASAISTFEASILGRLSHPNIIEVHSTGSIDECKLHYLCMPYCGRSTLTDVLDVGFQEDYPRRDDCIETAAQRWISDDESVMGQRANRIFKRFRRQTYIDGVLRIAIKVADALQYAHEQGILHGDLKPSNVLLTPDARPLLLDFNLSQDYLQSPGTFGGTLSYMPPEYLRLVARHAREQENIGLDVRPDIYSFGAMLYELLTGNTPVNVPEDLVDATTVAERMLARLKESVSPIRRSNPLVSQRLETIILDCLAFDPSRRPSTMGEVKKRLQAESRSLAALGRMARVRPLCFSAVVGLPLVLLTGSATYFALQPPRYLANYEEGMRRASDGDFERAASRFSAAIEFNPSFIEARFQLARTLVALDEFDRAIDHFDQIVRSKNDPYSMAYIGYCFNLKRMSVAAIPWYERAIQKDIESAAIYNNLGASYIDAQTQLSNAKRILLAEEYLRKALALDIQSLTVQLNIVRNAIVRSAIDRSYDPFPVWEHAKAVLKAAPRDRFIQSTIGSWYSIVIDRHFNGNVVIAATSDKEMAACAAFREVSRRADARRDEAVTPRVSEEDSSTLSRRRLFLEPIMLSAD